MSGPLPGGDGDATARLDRLAAQARAKAERYHAMQAAVGQVSVTESSKDGLVAVTVDSAGNVTDLRLTDRVRQLTGSQVASAVLATLRRAQSRLPERLGEVMAATIGDDRATVDTIVGNYRSKFPEPEPDEPEPVPERQPPIGRPGDDAPPPRPAPPKRARGGDEDEGWDDQSFMVRE
jgi:DNA-binding protein YbaB